jgi:hypothetical protein
LTTVGGEFWIQNNDLLEDITALSSLYTVGENLGVIYNSSLCCLSGLDNILPESIFNLIIHNNPVLTTCAIESICDYLTNPAGNVEIHDNASGCNSIEEVEDVCNVIPLVRTPLFSNEISIFPNPCKESIMIKISNIECSLPAGQAGMMIFNLIDLSGNCVKSQSVEFEKSGIHELEIDLSDLPAGVYFCAFKTDNGIQTKKIIKL